MSEHSCEKEQQVVDALRMDSCSPELREHIRQCPVCYEIFLVSDFLREETNLDEHELSTLPDAPLIWRKAQTLAREKALVQATLPIRVVRTCALVVAVLATPWLILTYRLWDHQLWPWMTELWPGHLPPIKWLWPSDLTTGTLLLALTGTLICIGLSSWYMVREE